MKPAFIELLNLRRCALFLGACTVALGCAAAGDDSAREANRPASDVDHTWELGFPASDVDHTWELGFPASDVDHTWELGWPVSASDAAESSGAAARVPDFTHWTDPDLSNESLDALRRQAQGGDVDAAVALASRLVDRYERGGTEDDLFEATVWIDLYHANEDFERSGLMARVQQRDCDHKVLRLHWLCDVGE